MLLAIRDKITGVIAWIIVIGISIVFGFWGVNSYVGGEDNFAIEVNGEKVSYGDYDRMLFQNRQELLRTFGGRLPAYFDSNQYLREQTLDMLINRELFSQLMDEYRFRIPEAEVASLITEDNRFRQNNEFKPEMYEAELRILGVSKQSYEDELQQRVQASQLESGVRSTAAASLQELSDFAKLQHQTRDFEFLQLSLEEQRKKIKKVSDAEVEEYYNAEANQARFFTNEKVKIEYVELSLKQLADEVKISDADLKEAYQQGLEQKRFVSEEVRQGSHILLKVAADASAETVEQKRAEALAIREQLVGGASFAELAKEKSEDTGSAANGGSLGDVRRDVMVKPFEDALFSLPKGEISQPIKTQFGFHLIRVDGIQGGEVQPFAEVRDELAKEYRDQQADPIFYDKLGVLEEQAYEGADLSAAATETQLQLKQSEWFTANVGEKIAENPGIRQAAFSEEVLKEGRNSAAIEVGPEHVVFLRIAEHEPSRRQTVEEAKEQISNELIAQQAQQNLDKLVSSILEQGSEAALETISKSNKGSTYKALKDVKRDSLEAAREVVQSAFRLPPPSGSKDALERVGLGNGDVALVRLQQIKEGDIAWLSDQEKDQLGKQLIQQRGQYDLGALIASLKEQADVVIGDQLQQSE